MLQLWEEGSLCQGLLESNQKGYEENVNLVVEDEKKATLVHDEWVQAKWNMLYPDNGVSNHICGNKNKFMDLDEWIKGNVIFANRSKFSIKKKVWFSLD